MHAYVGPFTSIMNDVEIRDSEIEHSIVLEGSSITTSANRVDDSLIGKNVKIYRAAGQAVGVPVHARRQLRSRDPLVEAIMTTPSAIRGACREASADRRRQDQAAPGRFPTSAAG